MNIKTHTAYHEIIPYSDGVIVKILNLEGLILNQKKIVGHSSKRTTESAIEWVNSKEDQYRRV